MLKLFRYTLAAIFLAAGVGCLGLWGRSSIGNDSFFSIELTAIQSKRICVETTEGFVFAGVVPKFKIMPPSTPWQYYPMLRASDGKILLRSLVLREGYFGRVGDMKFFPLWYPALVFAIAAVGVLRLGQRFTIRSALIATTVVAALLGMVVAL